MFQQTVPWYDLTYSWKDYAREARSLVAILRRVGAPARGRLLDVACGTGTHLERLRGRFEVEGADVSPGMLVAARKRLPGVRLHRADMRRLDLGRTFDVVTCLFSSIGYMRSVADLERAVAAMAKHVAPGGALAIEPWFTPAQWKTGTLHAMLREHGGCAVARMNVSGRRGPFAVMVMHHLVGTPRGVRHVVEKHVMRLFTDAEYEDAIRRAGLSVVHDRKGIAGRGLWIGLAVSRASRARGSAASRRRRARRRSRASTTA